MTHFCVGEHEFSRFAQQGFKISATGWYYLTPALREPVGPFDTEEDAVRAMAAMTASSPRRSPNRAADATLAAMLAQDAVMVERESPRESKFQGPGIRGMPTA